MSKEAGSVKAGSVKARSIEERFDGLETRQQQLDANQHSLARVCADIKNIALTNQHDIAGLKHETAGLKAALTALAEATHAGFRRTDEQIGALTKEVQSNRQETRKRFEQLELLIRQFLPKV